MHAHNSVCGGGEGVCGGSGDMCISEDNLWELALPFHHVDPWGPPQVVRLGGHLGGLPKSVSEKLLISKCVGKWEVTDRKQKGQGTQSLIHSGGSRSDELSRPRAWQALSREGELSLMGSFGSPGV